MLFKINLSYKTGWGKSQNREFTLLLLATAHYEYSIFPRVYQVIHHYLINQYEELK